jgi:hypothetical protein
MPTPEFFNWRDRAVKGTGAVLDAAHHLFVMGWWLQGNDSGIEINEYDPAGAFRRHWLLTPPPSSDGHPLKCDFVTMIQSGPDLYLIPGGHEAITSDTRQNPVWGMVLPNVCTPYAEGRNPAGGSYDAAAFRSIGGGGDPTPGPTLDEIAAAVLDAIKADMRGELGSLLQQKAKNGAREAITVEQAAPGYLHMPDSLLQVLRDGLYQWAIDRAFEGARAAIQGTAPDPASPHP